MTGILGSTWTPRFLSWSFQVLFGPSRYWIESSIFDNLRHQKGALKYLFFYSVPLLWPLLLGLWMLLAQLQFSMCYCNSQGLTVSRGKVCRMMWKILVYDYQCKTVLCNERHEIQILAFFAICVCIWTPQEILLLSVSGHHNANRYRYPKKFFWYII